MLSCYGGRSHKRESKKVQEKEHPYTQARPTQRRNAPDNELPLRELEGKTHTTSTLTGDNDLRILVSRNEERTVQVAYWGQTSSMRTHFNNSPQLQARLDDNQFRDRQYPNFQRNLFAFEGMKQHYVDKILKLQVERSAMKMILDKTTQENDDMRRQNIRLTQDRCAELKRVKHDFADLESRLRKCQEDLKSEREKCTSYLKHESMIACIKHDKTRLEENNKELKNENMLMNAELSELKKKFENQQNARLQIIAEEEQKLRQENGELRSKLTEMKQALDQTSQKSKALENNALRFKQYQADAKRRLDDLLEENNNLKRHIEETTFGNQLKEASETEQLRTCTTELANANIKLQKLAECEQMVRNENVRLQRQLSEKEQMLQQTREKATDELKALKLETSNTATKFNSVTINPQYNQIQIQKLIDELSNENENLKRTNNQQRNEFEKKLLEAIESNDYRQRLENCEMELKKTKAKLCQCQEDLQSVQKEYGCFKTQTNSEVALLQLDKNNLKSSKLNLQNENAQLKTSVTQLQKENSHLKADNSQLLEDNRQLMLDNSHLQNNDGQLKADITQLQNDKSKLNADIIRLQQENNQLETDKFHLQKDNNQLMTRATDQITRHSGDYDELKRILHHTETLLKQKEQEVEKTHTKIATLIQDKRDLEECKADLENRSLQMETYINNLQGRLETDRTAFADYDAMQQKLLRTEKDLKEAELELEDTKTRLSKSMGDKLTNNNPNIVDLSDMNRPSKLADRYKELYDNQWTDAYEVLETTETDEEHIITILLTTLIETKRFCDEQTRKQMEDIMKAITHSDELQMTTIPVGVLKYIKDCRKYSAAQSIKIEYEKYTRDLRECSFPFAKQALKINEYLKECFELCWLMAIQDPPVVLGSLLNHGDSFRTDLYSAYTVSGKIVDFAVWPALLLHDNGPTLTKGVAQGMKKA